MIWEWVLGATCVLFLAAILLPITAYMIAKYVALGLSAGREQHRDNYRRNGESKHG